MKREKISSPEGSPEELSEEGLAEIKRKNAEKSMIKKVEGFLARVLLSIAIILTTIVSIVMIRLGFRSRVFNKIILNAEQKDEKGYLSVDSMDKYLDKEGTCITGLRPSGFIEIDGIKLDALAENEYIPKDSDVKIVRVEGSKIFVRRV